MAFVEFMAPGEFSRQKHLEMIKVICYMEGKDKALRYWLRECPRISKAAFEEACRNARK